MNNEKSYIQIRKWFYHKFDMLTFYATNEKINLYDIEEDSVVRVYLINNEGEIFYYEDFMLDLVKIIPISISDFELFLTSWIEDKFKIKVINIHASSISQ